MDREMLVQLNDARLIPPLLKANWKARHWYDPVDAACKSLLLGRASLKASRRVGYSAAIGGAAFMGVAVLLAAVTTAGISVSGKPVVDTVIAFSVFFGGFVWGLANVVAMALGNVPGLKNIREEFRSEAFWFGKNLSDFRFAAEKSWNELMVMDLKALAEKMLVDRAKQVLLAEEKLGVGRGEFLDTAFAYEKINRAAVFKSLYGTLEELGLVSEESYKRFYTQAQKLREQEKKSSVADVVVNTGISHTMF